MKRFLIFMSAATMLCMLLVVPSHAAEEDQAAWIHSNDYSPNNVILSMDKLGRGLTNVLLGWMEIPKQSIKRAIDTESAYGYASGFVIGTGFFVLRELAGVYEIVTFPVPVPAHYEPVIDPILGYEPRVQLK